MLVNACLLLFHVCTLCCMIVSLCRGVKSLLLKCRILSNFWKVWSSIDLICFLLSENSLLVRSCLNLSVSCYVDF